MPGWTSTRSGSGTPSASHRLVHVRPGPAGHRCRPPRPAPPGTDSPPASGHEQPTGWRDTGKLPVTASDDPPGDEPGLAKVSVPEARRGFRSIRAGH